MAYTIEHSEQAPSILRAWYLILRFCSVIIRRSGYYPEEWAISFLAPVKHSLWWSQNASMMRSPHFPLQAMSSFLIKSLARTFPTILPSCSNRIFMSSRSRNGTARGAGISPAGRRCVSAGYCEGPLRPNLTVSRLASEKTPTPGYFNSSHECDMEGIRD
jgi:hypothetical protein